MGILKRAAATAFHAGGGVRLARLLNRGALRILMYHRLRNRAALEWQCAHLRRCYSPVSLSAVSAWLDSSRPLPPNAVAVTVDDGYEDVFETGFPVFREHGIPFTVFLVTGFLDRNLWLWGDRVEYAVNLSGLARASVELPNGERLAFALASREDRAKAAFHLKEVMKRMDNRDRLRLLESLPRTLDVVVPAEPPPGYQPMRWDQVRAMSAAGVEFGAHSESHPILSRLPDDAELRREVAGSKARIEQELRSPVSHFCYPNGRSGDFDQRVLEAVAAAGFRTAVTAESGLNHAGAVRFQLCRIGVDPELPAPYFRRSVAGVRV